jgi:hypothetical protein
MPTTPPEFAVAGLDTSVQLYQLTKQVKRLRGTVQRMWGWIGVLTLVAGASAAFDHVIPAPELLGRSLVLGGSGTRSYTVKARAEGLGIEVSDGSASKVADLLLRTEGNQVWIKRDGKVLWQSP